MLLSLSTCQCETEENNINEIHENSTPVHILSMSGLSNLWSSDELSGQKLIDTIFKLTIKDKSQFIFCLHRAEYIMAPDTTRQSLTFAQEQTSNARLLCSQEWGFRTHLSPWSSDSSGLRPDLTWLRSDSWVYRTPLLSKRPTHHPPPTMNLSHLSVTEITLKINRFTLWQKVSRSPSYRNQPEIVPHFLIKSTV